MVTRGALVVIGGHSRRVGKTTLVEQLLHASTAGEWTAVKISAHRHESDGTEAPLVEEARHASCTTQTGRYLAAGARRALLVRAPDASLAAAGALVESLCDQGDNIVVESNRVVGFLRPDLLLFVVDPLIADWKDSSADCLLQADAFVCHRDAEADPRVAELVRQLGVERPVFITSDPLDRGRLVRWVQSQLERVTLASRVFVGAVVPSPGWRWQSGCCSRRVRTLR